MDACREKYRVVCGIFYGHVSYVQDILSIPDDKLLPTAFNLNDSTVCGEFF